MNPVGARSVFLEINITVQIGIIEKRACSYNPIHAHNLCISRVRVQQRGVKQTFARARDVGVYDVMCSEAYSRK